MRFFRDGQAEYVTVDRFLPTVLTNSRWKNGQPYEALVFANAGEGATRYAGLGLWVALAEKAYAQWEGEQAGYVGIERGSGLEGGRARDALEHITGRQAHSRTIGKGDWMAEMLNALYEGKHIVLSTKEFAAQISDPRLVKNHAYLLTAIGSRANIFEVLNPWKKDNQKGPAATTLTLDELVANFSGFTWVD